MTKDAMVEKQHIMQCPCFPVAEDTVEAHIMHFVQHDMAGYAVAINAEKILKYTSNTALKEVIDHSLYPYPDGAGAVLGLRWLYGFQSEKINMPIRALETAHNNQLKVFIVGAKPEAHEAGVKIITTRYPQIELVGNMHGYHDEADIIAAITKAQPQLILLALGSPRQEIFAHKLINTTQSGLAIGCGGALDILAGNLKRAPEFWINNNIEWLYRLIQEPWRWRRQLFLPLFMLKLLGATVKARLNR